MERTLYLIGFKFGDREVIGYHPEKPNKRICKCVCGDISYVNISSIKRGVAGGCRKCNADKNRFDVIGMRRGSLVVLSEYSDLATRKERLFCQCDCGKIINVERNFRTKTCGCSRIQFKDRDRYKGIVTSWRCMKQRCTDPKHDSYPNYGAKGVIIWEPWFTFINFYNDTKDTWFEGSTIDRFPDTKGNYVPNNVRWATEEQQQRNKTNTRFTEQDIIEIRKSDLTQTELAKKYNVGSGTISQIINNKRWKNISE